MLNLLNLTVFDPKTHALAELLPIKLTSYSMLSLLTSVVISLNMQDRPGTRTRNLGPGTLLQCIFHEASVSCQCYATVLLITAGHKHVILAVNDCSCRGEVTVAVSALTPMTGRQLTHPMYIHTFFLPVLSTQTD